MGRTAMSSPTAAGFQVLQTGQVAPGAPTGITFQSHLDGGRTNLSSARESHGHSRRTLGPTGEMPWDECPPWPCEREVCVRADRAQPAMGRGRVRERCDGKRLSGGGASRVVPSSKGQRSTISGARRGNPWRRSIFRVTAIGGVSVGEPEPEMLKQDGPSRRPSCRPTNHGIRWGSAPRRQVLADDRDWGDRTCVDCVAADAARAPATGLAFTPERSDEPPETSSYRTDARPDRRRASTTTPVGIFHRAYVRHLSVAGQMTGRNPS